MVGISRDSSEAVGTSRFNWRMSGKSRNKFGEVRKVVRKIYNHGHKYD